MEYQNVVLEVRVHGRPVKEYWHNEELWIEGRKGTDFTLRIENRSGNRILAVPTIDGLSVMNGEEASYESSGYVLGPYQHLDIPGWRLDNDKVASFRFNKSGKSYAGKTGKPQNIGVIGCAFFSEKVLWVSPSPSYHFYLHNARHSPGIRTHSGGLRGQSLSKGMEVNCVGSTTITSTMDTGGVTSVYSANAAEPSLGTEFGSEMAHKVMTTTFQRANNKPEVEMTIHYGDREELKRRGVDFDQKPVVAHRPSAFPKEERGCKPPAGWSGR